MKFSLQENEALLELRNRIQDLELDKDKNKDESLIRWLRARDLNVNNAEEMLRKSMKWRKKNNVDKILEWTPPPAFRKIAPEEFLGLSRNGVPVFVLPFRYFDMELFLEFDKEEYMRFCIWNAERAASVVRSNQTSENQNYQVIFIYDVEGLNITNLLFNPQYLRFLKGVAGMIEDNYPEALHKAVIVSAPAIFSIIFSIVKTFLAKNTAEKFEVFGSDIYKIRERLTQFIPMELLPTRYGGSNANFEKVAYAHCEVPASNNKIEREGEVKVIIPAGQQEKFDFEVKEQGSTLNWEFTTENYDIGFAFLRPNDSRRFSTAGILRLDSHKEAQIGSITVNNPGTYTLVFDNSYSKLRPKELRLFVEVLPPTTISCQN